MLEGINLIRRFKKNHVEWIATDPSKLKRDRDQMANNSAYGDEDDQFEGEPNIKRPKLDNVGDDDQVSLFFILLI